ncbi:FAD-dependent oxidoreductase [Sphingomonas sp. LR61]|uniref:FAD-dependent oxidoreductase n=1 Tax=Sphingomonas sp. LR61 TaxID=3050234 RepID=UPI002FDF2598
MGTTTASSHGATRIFRQGYADPEYVALTSRALALWEALEGAADEELIVRTGAVDHGRAEVVDAIAAALTDAGIPHETLSPDAAAARWPGIAFEGHVLARHGRSHPVRPRHRAVPHPGGTDGARRAALRHGGDGARRPRRRRDRDAVRRVHPPQLVRGGGRGSWAPALVGDLLAGRGAGLPAIRVTQEQPAHFPSRLPDQAWPSFVHWAADDDVYGLLTPGEGVKVGFHGTGPVVDPDHRDFTPVPAEAERLQAYVARYVPGVDATKPTFISCLYDNSPDEDFVIDRRGPVTVATGFSGHGFKFAPLLGDMIADLATGGAAHPRFSLSKPSPSGTP